MNAPWKVVFAFVGVFVAGAVFGGFFMLRSSEALSPARAEAAPDGNLKRTGVAQQIAPAMLRQLAHRLKLTDEQRENIQPIVARADEQLQRLRRQNFQETSRVMEQMHADVSTWLTEEQRTELETIKQNLRERFRRAQDGKERRGELRGGLHSSDSTSRRAPGETTVAGDQNGN